MQSRNDPKNTQHKHKPLQSMLPPMPKESGDAAKDYRELRQWLKQLGIALEYALEHLTIEQFADGEIEKIGGKQDG